MAAALRKLKKVTSAPPPAIDHQDFIKSLTNTSLSFKSFILSMISILLVGLGFLTLIYYLSYEQIFSPPQNLAADYQTVTQEPNSLNLTLSSPEDNQLTFEPFILIEGTASKNSKIILSGEEADSILKVSTEGNFSETYKLKEGANFIKVSVFDSSGVKKSISRMVFYSKEKI